MPPASEAAEFATFTREAVEPVARASKLLSSCPPTRPPSCVAPAGEAVELLPASEAA